MQIIYRRCQNLFFCSLLLIRAAAGDEDLGDAEIMVWQLRSLRFFFWLDFIHMFIFAFLCNSHPFGFYYFSDCFEFLLLLCVDFSHD